MFLGVGWCLSGLLLVRAAAAVAPIYSGVELARAQPVIPPRIPYTVSARMINHCHFIGGARSNSWHTAANSTTVSSTILDAEIPSVAQFVERWNLESQAYAVMEIKMFDDLKSHDVPMREVGRDTHRVLAARR